jgi:hypothetical protein
MSPSCKTKNPALLIRCSLLLMIAVGLSSCGLAGAPASTFTPVTATPAASANTATPITAPTSAPIIASPTAQASTFADQFAYCAAVGTTDTLGPDYTGPKMPQTIAEALKKASGASPDAPLDIFLKGSFWRCMNGKVYACFVGANLPCDSKANTDKTPTTAETDFCKANPNSDFIPAAVTGHDTIYEWRCNQVAPEIVKQVFQVDERGYISDIWYPLTPP